MGCSGSKAIEAVKEAAQSETVMDAAQNAVSAVESTEVEQLQERLNHRVKENDKQRRKAQQRAAAAASEDRGSGKPRRSSADHHRAVKKGAKAEVSTTSTSSSQTSEEDTDEEDKKKRRDQKPRGRGQPEKEQGRPKAALPSSNADPTDSRGYVKAQQKDDVRRHFASTIVGGPHQKPHRDEPNVVATSSREVLIDDEEECLASIRCDDGDEVLAMMKELVVRARYERDSAQAETKRALAERDAARTDLVYLRAMADASDNFQHAMRIPPQWVASEHQHIHELRQHVTALESELVFLKNQVRRRRFSSSVTKDPAGLTKQLSGGNTTLSDVSGSPASPVDLPLSPSELISSLRVLRAQCVAAEQEVSTSRAAGEAAQADSLALSHQAASLKHEVQRLQHEKDDRGRHLSNLHEELAKTERQLEQKRRALSELTETVAAREVEEARRRESQEAEDKEKSTRDAASSSAQQTHLKKNTQSDAEQFLRQVSRILVSAEHCPDDVRLQLLQFVCEHGGLPIDGRPRLVSDTSEFDMNGILYGDSIALLAAMVISRPENRIESLILCETAMTDFGCAQIALTLAVLPFETPLRMINLSNNEISSRGVIQLLTAVQSCCSSRGGGGAGGGREKIAQRLVLDLDNNPGIYQTIEDVQMITAQVESMKRDSPLVEVLLPRVPRLEQLSGRIAQNMRSTSVLVPLGF